MFRVVNHEEFVGRTIVTRCGRIATLVQYKDSRHVRIRFDDGYEVWCKYGNFIEGNVKWFPNCIEKTFYDRYGDDYVVIEQNRGNLRVKSLTDGNISVLTVKQLEKMLKRSKYVGMRYMSLDGEKYEIIKVYLNKANESVKWCDIRFDNGFIVHMDLSNAIQGKVRYKQIRNRR